MGYPWQIRGAYILITQETTKTGKLKEIGIRSLLESYFLTQQKSIDIFSTPSQCAAENGYPNACHQRSDNAGHIRSIGPFEAGRLS